MKDMRLTDGKWLRSRILFSAAASGWLAIVLVARQDHVDIAGGDATMPGTLAMRSRQAELSRLQGHALKAWMNDPQHYGSV